MERRQDFDLLLGFEILNSFKERICRNVKFPDES